jgi:hypothetical protein
MGFVSGSHCSNHPGLRKLELPMILHPQTGVWERVGVLVPKLQFGNTLAGKLQLPLVPKRRFSIKRLHNTNQFFAVPVNLFPAESVYLPEGEERWPACSKEIWQELHRQKSHCMDQKVW